MLYLFTVDSRTATSGVVQIDITSASNPTFVKFTPTGGTGDVNFYIGGPQNASVPVGPQYRYKNKIYSFNAGVNIDFSTYPSTVLPRVTSPSANKMMCFNLDTQAACAENSFPVDNNSGIFSNIDISGGGLYVLDHYAISTLFRRIDSSTYSTLLTCNDLNNDSNCSDAWPMTAPTGASGGIFPVLSPTTGAVTGFCMGGYNYSVPPVASWNCGDFQNGFVTSSAPVGMTSAVTMAFGTPLAVGTRLYFPQPNNLSVACYDYATHAACSNFGTPKVFSNLSLLYTVTQDPTNPTCLWVNSHSGSGQIQNFDAYTGGACGTKGSVLPLSNISVNQQCFTNSDTVLNLSTMQVTSVTPAAVYGGYIDLFNQNGAVVDSTTISSTGAVVLTSFNSHIGTSAPLFGIHLRSGADIGSLTNVTDQAITAVFNYTGDLDLCSTNPDLYGNPVSTDHTITFDANGGDALTPSPFSETITADAALSTGALTSGGLPTPTWAGHNFLGWYTSATDGAGSLVDGSTVPSGDATYYAHWYDTTLETVTVSANDALYLAGDPTPTLSALVSPNGGVTETPTCAAYTLADTSYSAPITFNSALAAGNYVIRCQATAATGFRTPIYINGTLVVQTPLVITLDPTMGAFDGHGLGETLTEGIISGNNLTTGFYSTFPTPAHDGMVFDGWSTISSWDPTYLVTDLSQETPTANTTYYAQWINTSVQSYTVTADNQNFTVGGSEPALTGSFYPLAAGGESGLNCGVFANNDTHFLTSIAMSSISEPGNYTIACRPTNDTENFGNYRMVTGILTVRALVTVVFDPVGGDLHPSPFSSDVFSGDALSTGTTTAEGLPLPTHAAPNSVFDGWFTEREAGTLISSSTIVTSTATYYAHWSEPAPVPTGPQIIYNKDILSASAGGNAATISGNAVTIHVPYGTNVTSLPLTFSLTAPAIAFVGSILQVPGVTKNDYTAPVTFIITAPDGTTKYYTVTVIVDPAPVVTPTPATTQAAAPQIIVDAVKSGDVPEITARNRMTPAYQYFTITLPISTTTITVTVNGSPVDATIDAGRVSLPVRIGPKDLVVVTAKDGDSAISTTTVPYGNDRVVLANVNFDLASSDLTPAAIKILKKVIAVIKARGYTSVALNGHTDSNGAGVYDNKTLSLDRDNTVMGYLIAHLPNVQLTFTKKWFADKLPTASNDTEAGQAKNRRVEISAK